SVTVEEFLLVGQSLLIVGLVYWLWQRTMRNRQVSD
ncbi:YhfC family intramembrane metalloprotease, partial [Salmonella enterica subsp. enterica serovar Enteritidis]|nr:YhfC family intramembrane metalloprotease [Salmonella enterica subsp. enterica serovar Enteritidis]